MLTKKRVNLNKTRKNIKINGVKRTKYRKRIKKKASKYLRGGALTVIASPTPLINFPIGNSPENYIPLSRDQEKKINVINNLNIKNLSDEKFNVLKNKLFKKLNNKYTNFNEIPLYNILKNLNQTNLVDKLKTERGILEMIYDELIELSIELPTKVDTDTTDTTDTTVTTDVPVVTKSLDEILNLKGNIEHYDRVSERNIYPVSLAKIYYRNLPPWLGYIPTTNQTGGGKDEIHSKAGHSLLRLFDSIHDFASNRGNLDIKTIINNYDRLNLDIWLNFFKLHNVNKNNVEEKLLEHAESFMADFKEEILGLTTPEELQHNCGADCNLEEERLISNFLIPSVLESGTYKEQINESSVPFDNNMNIKSLSDNPKDPSSKFTIFKLLRRDQLKVDEDNTKNFFRMIKKKAGEVYSGNPTILFEAGKYNEVIKHLINNDIDGYEVDNFKPFNIIYADASIWDSATGKKIFHAEENPNETGNITNKVKNELDCLKILELRGIVNDDAIVNYNQEGNKGFTIHTGPPVSELSQATTSIKINKILGNKLYDINDKEYSHDTPTKISQKNENSLCNALIIKRSGDWSQVEFCKKYNVVLYTFDRLCALYAIFRNCPCIFESFKGDSYYITLFSGQTNKKDGCINLIKDISKIRNKYNTIKENLDILKSEIPDLGVVPNYDTFIMEASVTLNSREYKILGTDIDCNQDNNDCYELIKYINDLDKDHPEIDSILSNLQQINTDKTEEFYEYNNEKDLYRFVYSFLINFFNSSNIQGFISKKYIESSYPNPDTNITNKHKTSNAIKIIDTIINIINIRPYAKDEDGTLLEKDGSLVKINVGDAIRDNILTNATNFLNSIKEKYNTRIDDFISTNRGNYGLKKRELLVSMMDYDYTKHQKVNNKYKSRNLVKFTPPKKDIKKMPYVYPYPEGDTKFILENYTFNYDDMETKFVNEIMEHPDNLYTYLFDTQRYELILKDNKLHSKFKMLLDKIREFERITIGESESIKVSDVSDVSDICKQRLTEINLKIDGYEVVNPIPDVLLDIKGPLVIEQLNKLLKWKSQLNDDSPIPNEDTIKESLKDFFNIYYTTSNYSTAYPDSSTTNVEEYNFCQTTKAPEVPEELNSKETTIADIILDDTNEDKKLKEIQAEALDESMRFAKEKVYESKKASTELPYWESELGRLQTKLEQLDTKPKAEKEPSNTLPGNEITSEDFINIDYNILVKQARLMGKGGRMRKDLVIKFLVGKFNKVQDNKRKVFEEWKNTLLIDTEDDTAEDDTTDDDTNAEEESSNTLPGNEITSEDFINIDYNILVKQARLMEKRGKMRKDLVINFLVDKFNKVQDNKRKVFEDWRNTLPKKGGYLNKKTRKLRNISNKKSKRKHKFFLYGGGAPQVPSSKIMTLNPNESSKILGHIYTTYGILPSYGISLIGKINYDSSIYDNDNITCEDTYFKYVESIFSCYIINRNGTLDFKDLPNNRDIYKLTLIAYQILIGILHNFNNISAKKDKAEINLKNFNDILDTINLVDRKNIKKRWISGLEFYKDIITSFKPTGKGPYKNHLDFLDLYDLIYTQLYYNLLHNRQLSEYESSPFYNWVGEDNKPKVYLSDNIIYNDRYFELIYNYLDLMQKDNLQFNRIDMYSFVMGDFSKTLYNRNPIKNSLSGTKTDPKTSEINSFINLLLYSFVVPHKLQRYYKGRPENSKALIIADNKFGPDDSTLDVPEEFKQNWIKLFLIERHNTSELYKFYNDILRPSNMKSQTYVNNITKLALSCNKEFNEEQISKIIEIFTNLDDLFKLNEQDLTYTKLLNKTKIIDKKILKLGMAHEFLTHLDAAIQGFTNFMTQVIPTINLEGTIKSENAELSKTENLKLVFNTYITEILNNFRENLIRHLVITYLLEISDDPSKTKEDFNSFITNIGVTQLDILDKIYSEI